MLSLETLCASVKTFIKNIQKIAINIQSILSRFFNPSLLLIKKTYAFLIIIISKTCDSIAFTLRKTAESIMFLIAKTCALYQYIHRRVYVSMVIEISPPLVIENAPL